MSTYALEPVGQDFIPRLFDIDINFLHSCNPFLLFSLICNKQFISFEATGSKCVCKRLIVKPFSLSTNQLHGMMKLLLLLSTSHHVIHVMRL